MDRLSAMDAGFLFGEDANSRMDIGMILEFQGDPVTVPELAEAVEGRLPLVPRYRQKVKLVPGSAGLPVWVDDAEFAVRRHLFETQVDPRADPQGFEAIARVMGTTLDRHKPLWEMHLITGMPEDRWLLVIRMHHGMVDGITSTAIVGKLLTTSPEPPEAVEDNWTPAPEPSDWQMVQAALTDNAKAMADVARKTAALALKPFASPPSPPPKPEVLEGLRPVGPRALDPSLTGPVGPGRRFHRSHFKLDDVKQIRAGLGGTVNDVVLTIAARAFRALLLRRGEIVTGRTVLAMMPVALKGGGGEDGGGNRIGAVPVELPVGELTAAECLARIKQQTSALKVLGDAVPADVQVQTPGFGLPVVMTLGARVASTMPATVDTVVSNVPGPQEPLYFQGRRLEALSAMIALWTPLRLAVQVLSYAGTLSFAVVADRDSVPEIDWFVTGAEEALEQLKAAVSGQSGTD
jgi:diacylglycerol O-acyltransferase / wax synthase